MKKLIYLIIPFFLASCVIEQNYDFDEGLGGSYSMNFNMEGMMDFLPDSLKNEENEINFSDMEEFEELGKIEEEYKKVKGLSNYKMETSGASWDISYDFQDLGVLQRLSTLDIESGSSSSPSSGVQFVQKGNKLYIDMTPDDSLDDMKKEMGDMPGSMGDMFTFYTTISFKKPISKVKSKLGVFNKDNNSIEYTFNIEDIYSKKTKWKTVVFFEE